MAAPIFKEFMGIALADQPPVPFRVPPGLRLVRVSAATGQLAGSGQSDAIWEAFLPGTEPGADHPPPPNAEMLTNAGRRICRRRQPGRVEFINALRSAA